MWCIPPKQSAEFVFHMEDVLEVYHRPHDPYGRCSASMKTFKQLIGESAHLCRSDLAWSSATTTSTCATASRACSWPASRWPRRHVAVTAHRRRGGLSGLRPLLARRTLRPSRAHRAGHGPAQHASLVSLYEAFSPEEARRLAERIELHHTPKHGSWLNIAEIELSALGRQCLARRIAHQDTLRRTVELWEDQRNATITKVDWQFTTEQARTKLRSSTHQFTTDNALVP